MKLFLSILLLCMVTTAMAETNVYQCRDVKGKNVFQQIPCSESKLVIKDVAAYNLWKQMKELSGEGKNTLSNLTGEIASIKECNRLMEHFNNNVIALNNDVKRMNKNYVELTKAYSYLKDCGICRTSAEANCRTADRYLEKAVVKLTKY